MSELVYDVESLYGWNWASVDERDRFLTRLGQKAAPGFQWRAESHPAPRRLPIWLLRRYLEAIEEDFEVFVYEAEAIEEDDHVVSVRGMLRARTRLSRESFSRPFTHRWITDRTSLERVELPEAA